jgi:hypothetical protein
MEIQIMKSVRKKGSSKRAAKQSKVTKEIIVDSLKNYTNAAHIKRAYIKALKTFSV